MNNKEIVYRCSFPTEKEIKKITVLVKLDEAETQQQLEDKILIYAFDRYSSICDNIEKYVIEKLWDLASCITIIDLANDQKKYSELYN